MTLEEKVKAVLYDRLGVHPDDIKMDSKLRDDLDADSLDLVDLGLRLEDELKVESLKDAWKVTTFAELLEYARKAGAKEEYA